jgi:hypothetical protein
MLIINDTDGHIDPRNSLRLFTANAILNASMGKRFTSTEDPEFKQISHLVSKVLDFFTAGNDMSLYLPILSFMYRFTNIERKMDDFVKNTLNPIITRLVTEAKSKDEPNFFKELIQDRDEDKSYIISKF